MLSNSTVAPVLALLLNALVWGVSWWPLKQLQNLGVHPLWATAVIYLVVAVVVGIWRPGAVRLLARTPSLWWILIASGFTNAAFNWAVGIGDVVRAVLLFYLMPLWSLPLARLLLQERMTAPAVLRAMLTVIGAAFVLVQPGASAQASLGSPAQPLLADVLATLSGFAFALNTVMLRRGAALPSEGRAMAMFLGGAMIAGTAAIAFSSGTAAATMGVGFPSASGPGLVLVAGLAAAFLASNLCLQFGAARLTARVTAVVMPCEVVFAAVTAVWWGGAAVHAGLMVGGALILSAAFASVLGRR